MGFWGDLGRGLLKVAAPVAAGITTVATGGAAAPAWAAALPGLLGAAGSVVSGMGGAATANRGEQDQRQVQRDSVGLAANRDFDRAQLDRADLDLRRREDTRTAEADAYKKALKTALALNMSDASFNRPAGIPTLRFSGGARPSAIGPQGRQAAEVLNSQMLQRLMEPQAYKELPAPEKFQVSEPSKAGFWEKLAGPVGLGLSAAGSIMDARGGGGGSNVNVAGINPNAPAQLARILPRPAPTLTAPKPWDDVYED